MLHSAKKLILLVEDDEALREVLTEALAQDGFEVATAVDGQDALDWLSLAARTPAAVITDLLMPRIDGWELRHRLHTERKWQAIPVVVLSSALHARPWPEGETPAGQLGKPPALAALLDLVLQLTRQSDGACA